MKTLSSALSASKRTAKKCENDVENFQSSPFTIVIFGGTGDLSKKKLLPAIFHLYQAKLIKQFSILALGRSQLTNAQYRELIEKALKKNINFDKKTWDAFSKKLFYQSIDLTDANNYKVLCKLVTHYSKKHKTDNVLYYLAIRPSLVPVVIDHLAKQNLCRDKAGSKVIIEKPFGQDKLSAKKLNKKILKAFDENQIYRIDHYLGKETVQNILFFRFANNIFEPLWNRDYVDHIQITVAEDIGIVNRGAYYEEAGVIRDIIQNHVLQLMAMVMMEAPVGFEPDLIRDEKVKLFRSVRLMSEKEVDNHVVCGQYGKGKVHGKAVLAYRDEKNVSKNSKTSTYFAGKFYVDNWRWSDVPVYVRTGKRMSEKLTQIVIEFKKPPLKLLGNVCDSLEPNLLIISIQPQEGISIKFSVKQPGPGNHSHVVDMAFKYEDVFKIEPLSAYERLLIDSMKSDQTLFARQDSVELMWSIVDPIISRLDKKERKSCNVYPAGSWGPKEADKLIQKDKRRWHSSEK